MPVKFKTHAVFDNFLPISWPFFVQILSKIVNFVFTSKMLNFAISFVFRPKRISSVPSHKLIKRHIWGFVLLINAHYSHILLNFWVVISSSNQALGGIQGVLGVGDSLTSGRSSHNPLSIGRECDDRWRCASSFAVFQYPWVFPLHDRDTRVGRAKVNANDVTFHLVRPSTPSSTQNNKHSTNSCVTQT